MNRNYWAVRTSRDTPEIREFLLGELRDGRLRQGWGYDDWQDLQVIQRKWDNEEELSPAQKEAGRHWRMGNRHANAAYMQKGDWVLVPNTPENGRFTICEVTGDYRFSRATPHGDYRHIRPVRVLTPEGVVNNHQLVHGDLRRSLRCQSRMWNIYPHRASLKQIIDAVERGDNLDSGLMPGERAENLIAPIIKEMSDSASKKIADKIFETIRAEEYEPVLQIALERLFSISVNHTGGSLERGADLEIVIKNPFTEDDNSEWIVPVQVKDYDDEVSERVADQLKEAFCSRSKTGHVIAVVLMVTNAIASPELKERMCRLSDCHKIPFIYCGPEEFRNIIGKGWFSHSVMKSYNLNSEI